MIELLDAGWFMMGLASGILHATMLWRGSRWQSDWAPLLGLLRLGVVSGALVIAALCGGILATALGWALGFVASVRLCLSSRERHLPASSNSPSSNEMS